MAAPAGIPVAGLTRQIGQAAVVNPPGVMPCIVGWDHVSETWEPARVIRRLAKNEWPKHPITTAGGLEADEVSLSLPMCWAHASLSWGM